MNLLLPPERESRGEILKHVSLLRLLNLDLATMPN